MANNYCLFTRSLRAEIHLGSDGTRLELNVEDRLLKAYKYAGLVVYGNKR